MSMNLAEKFSAKVDERFSTASYADEVVGNAYEFDGVDTVNVYSIPTAPMNDYNRHASSGVDRYGNCVDLQASVQRMKISRDRSFTFGIDRGDLIQSQMVLEANRALSRQINEVVIPEYDSYVFRTIAAKATNRGNLSTTTPTKSNAYSLLLRGQEFLGDHLAPDQGRVAVCSYAFANLLKQDSSFVRYGDSSQTMLTKGIIGEVDGVKIMRVPSSRLPSGCSCILTHPYATVAPRQLREYKIHDNPVGFSGYKVEGRLIYDCFVLDNKVDGIYYIGGSGVLKVLNVVAARGVVNGRFTLLVNPEMEPGNRFYYRTCAMNDTFGAEYGADIDDDEWRRLYAVGGEIVPENGDEVVEVVEVDQDMCIVGYGLADLKK